MLALLPPSPVRAQFDDLRVEMTNLLEFQVGRDFANEEDDRERFFDQFLMDIYPSANVRVGLRVERFQDSTPPELFGFPAEEYEYDRLAQRFVEWSTPQSTFRLGNSYAILGSGLVFRSFELPGVVRQTLFPIVSYAESRDFDGAVFEGWYGPVEVTALHGTPVTNPDVAPEQVGLARRSGSVTAGRAMVRVVDGLRVGGSAVRGDGWQPGAASSERESVGAAELELEPFALVPDVEAPVYLRTQIEYAARSWVPFEGGFGTSTGKPHAFYTNTQLSWDSGAVGVETKDYHQFRLGVNDPPTLVPEFTHRLLNRTTHVLDPLDERGHQISLGQALPSWLGGGSIEVVHARAKSRVEVLGDFRDARRYEQDFVAIESDPMRSWRVRAYFSDGKDETEALREIRTVGLFASSTLPRELAVEVDVGHQVRKLEAFGGGLQRSDDVAVVALLSKAGLGQVGVLWEKTNDPQFEDDPLTPDVETDPRSFFGATASWRINAQHDVIVFTGKRRGGVACTSGTCYFVPDFEGSELRVTSRF